MSTYRPLRRRQIHLDFHTSEHIPDVGADFDAEAFADGLVEAAVDSVTVFAKCVHGWSYYPTRAGAAHPNLVRPDLLGEMMAACAARDIETPVYLGVQWDERIARTRPDWRAMPATNKVLVAEPGDMSALNQLSAAWHTLCLSNRDYIEELKAQVTEVLEGYAPPGLFLDILLPPDCVCPNCLARMEAAGRDPREAADRRANDLELLDGFRAEMSAHIRSSASDCRIFYNSGHIAKWGADRFAEYTHLELESLPTGGWGYDHFPTSARYADALGFDFLGHTGKFHTAWGDFGGFKHPHALIYETAQMSALGSKCLVGDQLHPSGALNPDTYASIAPAYRRIRDLEPVLDGARYMAEVAILASEYFHRDAGARNRPADDGAAQMLLEAQVPFDIIDAEADFTDYRLLILPDDIPVDATLAARLDAFRAGGGALILSGASGLSPEGGFGLDLGLVHEGAAGYDPVYVDGSALPGLPQTPFVVYSGAARVRPEGAEVLAQLRAPYFNRSFARFCSHQQAPDDPTARDLGPAVTIRDRTAYVAMPIFGVYHATGQPLFRTLVTGLIDRLVPDPILRTSLPSAGRASLMQQGDRHVLHLLYGAPQVRGRAVKHTDKPAPIPLEIIEDIPVIGAVTASLRLPEGTGATDALTGENIPTRFENGRLQVEVDRLHIHAAIVLERERQ